MEKSARRKRELHYPEGAWERANHAAQSIIRQSTQPQGHNQISLSKREWLAITVVLTVMRDETSVVFGRSTQRALEVFRRGAKLSRTELNFLAEHTRWLGEDLVDDYQQFAD